MNLNEIKNLPHKTAISTPVQATIESCKERKTGIGQYNKSAQNAKLTQGNDFMYASFENHDDLTNLVGSTVTVEPGQDKEGNPCGIYADHNGNYVNVRFTKSAKIKASMGQQGSPPPQPAKTPPSPTMSPNTASPTMSPKAELNRLANTMLHCYQAMMYVKEEAKKMGVSIADEQFEQKVTGLFIEANRKGITNHIKPGPFDAPANVPPPPEPEPQEGEDDLDDDIPF